jgi:hypothetical protein
VRYITPVITIYVPLPRYLPLALLHYILDSPPQPDRDILEIHRSHQQPR